MILKALPYRFVLWEKQGKELEIDYEEAKSGRTFLVLAIDSRIEMFLEAI